MGFFVTPTGDIEFPEPPVPAAEIVTGKEGYDHETLHGCGKILTNHLGKLVGLAIELESLPVYRMKGIGYSHPEWGHGRWKGELAVGGSSWTIEECDNMEVSNQHIQSVMRATCGDQQGIGVMEQIHMGPSRKYGFKEFLDPAT